MPDEPATSTDTPINDDWRIRAEQAERELATAQADAAAARQSLQTLERAAEDARKQAHIQVLLHQAGALDLAAATRQVIDALGDKPLDRAAAVIADLRKTSPALFARSTAASSAPIGPSPDPLERARAEASTGNDRRALLRYLRARRSA